MQTSPRGIAFVAANEGYAPKPTDDNGHLMWGHGHDQQPGELPPYGGISLADADILLAHDLSIRFEPAVRAAAPWANQNQFDALVDFTYNEGIAALSIMLHHGQAQVPTQILAWCYEHVNGVAIKSAGLFARRQKELALYEENC